MDSYHKDSDVTIAKVNKAYNKATSDINEDINKIFNKFHLDSKLTTTEVSDLLNSKISTKELQSIRNRIYSIQDEDIKRYMMAQLNANAYKARITRLEALKESIAINTKVLADTENRATTMGYVDSIKSAYYKNTFDIQQGLGFGFNFAEMPTGTIQEILKQNWSGKHYSKRIWNNTDVLAERLEETIMAGLMQGKNSRMMAIDLEDLSTMGKMAAERLVRTETTYITNQAELESYRECGIDRYVFVATLDTRTSNQCKEHDKKVYYVDKATPGENLPALHPYCRSTTIAYFGEDNLNSLERRARDPETGKSEVIKNMSYDEWYKKYPDSDIIKDNNRKTSTPNWQGIDYNSNYNKKEAIQQIKDVHGIEFKDSRNLINY